jgi:AraC-like DNA-binding protein
MRPSETSTPADTGWTETAFAVPESATATMSVDPATGDRRREAVIFASDGLTIVDRVQIGARTGWSPTRGGGEPSVVFLRAGLFECRTLNDFVLTESSHVKVYNAAHEYNFRRVQDGGEHFTLFYPGRAFMEEAFADAGFQASCESDIHYRHLKLYRMLRRQAADALDVGEAAFELMGRVAGTFGSSRPVRPAGPAVRRRLRDAQAYVAADPARDHRLSEVARIAGCSEFHFARLFRAETGQSLRSYRRRLRLRLALRLISEGQDDLTRVALDSGFNSHSHMTATFQQSMGRTPSAARSQISIARH